MSWLSIFSKITHGLQTGTAIGASLLPQISLIPGAGPIATTVLNTITGVEGLISTPGTGPAKKTAAVAIINAAHPGLNQSVLSSSIDGVLSALNALESAVAAIEASKAPIPIKSAQETTPILDAPVQG